MMRISQNMLSSSTLNNVESNLAGLLQTQEQLSTGRSINAPSDNPIGFSRVMELGSEIDANNQYKSNASTALTWLKTTDSSLQEVESAFQRARQLTVQGMSDTLTANDRTAIADEIDQIKAQLRDIGNTQLNGEYIFAGTDVLNQPYPSSGLDPNNTGTMSLQMGDSITVPYNTLGVNVFGRTQPGSGGTPPVDTTNIFNLLTNLSTALRSNNSAAISAILPQLDQRNDAVLEQQSQVGALTNRLTLLSSRIDDQVANLQGLKSQTGDADMAQLITQLNQQNSVYQASLAAGARVIEPSLLDYLK